MSVKNILATLKADIEALTAKAHADLEAFFGHAEKVVEADAPKVEQVAVSLEADAGKDLTADAAEEKKEG